MENVEYIQQSASPRPVVSLYSVPSMIKGERRQLPVFRQRLAALSLAAFWAAELFVCGQYAAAPARMGNFYRQLEYVLMRNTTMLVLHIIAVCAAIIILPRVALWLLFCLNAVFFVVIIEYGQVFNRPLSWGIITHQAQDLWGVLTPDVQWINQKTFLLVVAGVLIKFLLSRCYAPGALFSKKQRLVFGVLCCVSWAILVVWTATVYGFHKDPTAKNRNLPPEKLAPIIGYLPAWLLDAVTIRNEQHLAEAVAHADTGESRLIGAEAMFPVPPRIAAIQVESLDWDSLSLVYEGQEVVPNFRKISQEAMLYKVVSLHHNGSVDMDFAFLTRREPSRNVVNYRIIGFPYDNSTVELAEQMGYETVALHNHSGESFHRRYAFSKMGFDNMVFAEEMRRLFPVHRVRMVDEVLFRVSSAVFTMKPGPQFQLLITMTSHPPFRQYPPGFDDLVLRPQTRLDDYINSINYVDRQFGRYLAAIPDGTLILLWGDHCWDRRAQYHKRHNPEKEYVPFMIYQKGQDLSSRQKTKDTGLALGGELDFLDMARFVYAVLDDYRREAQGLQNPAAPAGVDGPVIDSRLVKQASTAKLVN